ncbi:hypothetical protein [Streptomyces sp. NPDC008240]|uniref:hypothetical protein n=1 Tax=Streptomyces sp. NPDC008240 TaxID=3364822 RepID=UPI0036E04414
MAIDKVPGEPDPDWDAFTEAHADRPAAPASTGAPIGSLDVEALTRIIGQSQQVTAQITGRNTGKVPAWARTDWAKAGYWTAVVPTLVSGCANLAAHQWPGWQVPFTGGLVSALALTATIAGLNRHWNPAATAVASGIALGGMQFATAAGSGGWMEIVAWLTGAAGTMAFSILWNSKHAEDKAKVELIRAKTGTEHAKRDAVQVMTQVKAAHELLKIDQTRKAGIEERPYLGGTTGEERALREAFWGVFGETLLTCDVTSTLSGWKAIVGLTRLSRKEARAGWDKVQTVMRADGRFIVSDGRVTNELLVKFVSSGMRHGGRTAWDEQMMPDPDDLMMSLGTDTETGEEVLVRFDERLLITGASGTGKSWSTRPLMAHAHLRGELILIDGKGEEANVWDGVCRCATDTPEIIDAIEYAHAEMNQRKTEMRARGLSVWDGPQLTVNVDEGQVILAMIAGLKKGRDDLLQKAIELSSLGRSRGVVLWWQTQYGVTSGDAPGIHKMIAPNMLQRFSLRVANGTHALVALDDCAYYEPQSIPDDRAFRGHGYLKGYGPVLIRTWTMDDQAVKALPAAAVESGTPAFGASPEDRVRAYRAANPGASQRAVADATGVSLGKVNGILKGR